MNKVISDNLRKEIDTIKFRFIRWGEEKLGKADRINEKRECIERLLLKKDWTIEDEKDALVLFHYVEDGVNINSFLIP